MQQLNPSEISEIIKQRIAGLEFSTEAQNEGTVVSVTDGIIRIHGLAEVAAVGQQADSGFLRKVPGIELESDGTADARAGHAGSRWRRARVCANDWAGSIPYTSKRVPRPLRDRGHALRALLFHRSGRFHPCVP